MDDNGTCSWVQDQAWKFLWNYFIRELSVLAPEPRDTYKYESVIHPFLQKCASPCLRRYADYIRFSHKSHLKEPLYCKQLLCVQLLCNLRIEMQNRPLAQIPVGGKTQRLQGLRIGRSETFAGECSRHCVNLLIKQLDVGLSPPAFSFILIVTLIVTFDPDLWQNLVTLGQTVPEIWIFF